MLLVDTNVVSELMRQRPDPGVLNWAGSLDSAGGRMSISVVTVGEIIFGLARRPRPRQLAWFDGFVARHHILDVTETIARRAGEMRGMLSVKGDVRSHADMLIAATAQVCAFTVVTRNVRDFEGCGVGILNPFSD